MSFAALRFIDNRCVATLILLQVSAALMGARLAGRFPLNSAA
jgi:hypothetical protein